MFCLDAGMLTDSLAHDAEVSRDGGRNGEAEGHDGEGDDAAADGRDAAGRGPEDGDDGEAVALDELDEVVVADADAPPDEVEEDARDEHADQTPVPEKQPLGPRGPFRNVWWRHWSRNYEKCRKYCLVFYPGLKKEKHLVASVIQTRIFRAVGKNADH